MNVISRLYHGETNIDFIGRRRLWFAVSGTVVLICLIALGTRGLNYGIEFEGGVQLEAVIASDGPLGSAAETGVISRVRDSLKDVNASSAQIQVVTDDTGSRSVSVQTKEISDPQQQQAVVTAVADAVGAKASDIDSQRIGSKWGAEITDKALRALIVFVIVILAFISFRFEWKMAVAAIIALAHDLIITAGVYSLVGFEVTPSTVIAILTILGYSLYDTVVVFDKVEENTEQLAVSGRMTYQDSANLAMNQVFMRSLNTSLVTLLPVAALLFVGAGLLGAQTLEDLALALLVGILVGTYSSIFVATPVLSLWKEREPKYRSVKERMQRDAQRRLARTEEEPVQEAPERVPAAVGTGPSQAVAPSRPRAGSKKARRRKRR
jgi:preprotein translocase subunit SecF